MAQQEHQLPLRELTVSELISLAIHRRRRLLSQGRTTRRIVLFLPPYLLPPPPGEYESFMGVVRISSVFKPTEGRWIVTVRLPLPEEGAGFKPSLSQPRPLNGLGAKKKKS
jgi:hypothetical protein